MTSTRAKAKVLDIRNSKWTLAEELSDYFNGDYSREEVQDIIEGLCLFVEDKLLKEEPVHLWGFGTFFPLYNKQRWKFSGVNGDEALGWYECLPSITMKFIPTRAIKARMRQRSRDKMREDGTLVGELEPMQVPEELKERFKKARKIKKDKQNTK